MKKKKIIVALLASVCIAAGAAGIAACSGGDTSPTYDPTLYAAYQKYTQTTDNPLSYEAWIADIITKFEAGGEKGENGFDGEDGATVKTINLININGKEYYEFVLSNGKIIRLATDGSDKQVTTGFTITAVDQNGDPVKDAYFHIGYVYEYRNHYFTEQGTFVDTGDSNFKASLAYTAKTNEKGIATFYAFPKSVPSSVTEYKVFLADPYAISSDGESRNVPKGYSVNFGKDQFGMNKTNASFIENGEGDYTVTVKFVLNNDWRSLYDASNDLKYKRYLADYKKEDDITEDYKPYVKSAHKNRYNYFTLEPAKAVYPSGASDALKDQIDDLARTTATGVYRISWKANKASANVQLLHFNFYNGNYFYSNEDGSPSETLVVMHSGNLPDDEKVLREKYDAYVRDNGSIQYEAWLGIYSETFSGTNYVDVAIEFEFAHLQHCFAFIADMDCEVTISVERISDVPKWSDVKVVAELPAGATKEPDHEGRIIDAPLSSTVVRDSNGVYHLNSISGPIIYVQILNGTRANSNSMLFLSAYTVGEGTDATTKSLFSNYISEEFNEATNSGVRTHTDYTEVIRGKYEEQVHVKDGYADLANSAGLYPVNDQLKTILETFCKSFAGWNRYENYWLAACAYYGPVSDGSANAPYDLTVGNNTVNLNGATYVAFKAATMAYYRVSSSIGSITLSGALDIEGEYFFKANANEEVTFTITGNGSATVSVAAIASSKIIEYTYDGSNEIGSEATPVEISGSGVYQVNINHDTSNGKKIAVDLTVPFLADGDYKITIYGGKSAEVLDVDLVSMNGKTIALVNEEYVRLWLDDVEDGTFFIKVTRVS